jgi:hypothetical protein
VQKERAAGKSDAERAAAEARKVKAAAAAQEAELAKLLRASIKQEPVPDGVDPKSIVCAFFKAKLCEKGDRCKFSHDLTVQRKALKIDLYSDRRDGAEGGDGKAAEDEMANWDTAKLEAVVKTKHGAEAGLKTKTDIVCKFFLDAIEAELYGFFWVCPNGGAACKYRHALPSGYVFKSKKAREEEAAAKRDEEMNAPDITERIEEERARLPSTGLTPVTAESFAAWKARRDERRKAEAKDAAEEAAKKGAASGRDLKLLSGRALFAVNQDLFKDDDAAGGLATYARRDEDEAGDEGEGEGEGEGDGDGDGEGDGGGDGEDGEGEEEEDEAGEGEDGDAGGGGGGGGEDDDADENEGAGGGGGGAAKAAPEGGGEG